MDRLSVAVPCCLNMTTSHNFDVVFVFYLSAVTEEALDIHHSKTEKADLKVILCL